MYDPTDKVIGKLEIVGNNGEVIVKKDINSKKVIEEYYVPTRYSFYYVRIAQPDGDMIVSAILFGLLIAEGVIILNIKK